MKMTTSRKKFLFLRAAIFPIFGLILLLPACRKAQTTENASPPVVEVVKVLQRDVPVYSEWTASIDGFVNATIRAQVQGYLISQDYREGDFVRKGQVLFKIDPRPFQAALEQAKGQLAEAQARWGTAKANFERMKPLVEQNAVSKKDFDDAVGTEQATMAAVVAAQAVVDKAQVDLGFTRVASPIDGIAGIATAQLGDLVGPGSIEELTTVSTVNPIKVYVPMNEQEYLTYAQNRQGHARGMPLDLLLADGSTHPQKGTFVFADRQVDVRTGTIKVAALFPNPGNVLRPGQFARIRAQTAVRRGALLVPQRAVMELQGAYRAAVVTPDNRVVMRPVKVSGQVAGFATIDEGVNPGERVVAEGLQKVKDGDSVTVKPFELPPSLASQLKPEWTHKPSISGGQESGER